MKLRILNLVVIGLFILAAAYVYRIKFEATVQAERLAKIRSEVRHERDRIAALRAEWGQLDNPARIEALAKRFLQLKPVAPTQFDTFDQLPDRPPQDLTTAGNDPIAGIIENLEEKETVTGSIPAAPGAKTPDQAANPAAYSAPNPAAGPLARPAIPASPSRQ